MIQTVFVDANVFYSRTLRDWLFLLRKETGGDLFTLASSWDVLTEAGNHLRNQHPASAGHLVSKLVEKFLLFTDEIVEEYPGGSVPWIDDEGDWHVHHAATACGASYLLSEDKGFNDQCCSYTSITCDDFFMHISRLSPVEVKDVVRAQLKYWENRSNAQSLSDALRATGCPNFADLVEGYIWQFSTRG